MTREKLSFAQKTCVASSGKLMQQAGMLVPGARIGIALSGGEDSLTLLKVLTLRRRILPFPIELMALHINPGFEDDAHKELHALCLELGVPLHAERTDHGPRAHSEENRKNSPCFFCCRLRRLRLFELMRHYRLNRLAMGHHADDLVATFFLNLFQGGRVDGLSMRESYFGGEFELIRPLLWVEKNTISRACRQWGLPVRANPCPTSATSRRATLQQWFEQGPGKDKRVRRNVLNALRNQELERVLGRAAAPLPGGAEVEWKDGEDGGSEGE